MNWFQRVYKNIMRLFGKKSKKIKVLDDILAPDKEDEETTLPFKDEQLNSCLKHFCIPKDYHCRPTTKKLLYVTASRNAISYAIEGTINDWSGHFNHYIILAGKFCGLWCVAPTEHGLRTDMCNAYPECFKQIRKNKKEMFESPMDEIDPEKDDLWIKIIQKDGSGSTNWVKLTRG